MKKEKRNPRSNNLSLFQLLHLTLSYIITIFLPTLLPHFHSCGVRAQIPNLSSQPSAGFRLPSQETVWSPKHLLSSSSVLELPSAGRNSNRLPLAASASLVFTSVGLAASTSVRGVSHHAARYRTKTMETRASRIRVDTGSWTTRSWLG